MHKLPLCKLFYIYIGESIAMSTNMMKTIRISGKTLNVLIGGTVLNILALLHILLLLLFALITS